LILFPHPQPFSIREKGVNLPSPALGEGLGVRVSSPLPLGEGLGGRVSSPPRWREGVGEDLERT